MSCKYPGSAKNLYALVVLSHPDCFLACSSTSAKDNTGIEVKSAVALAVKEKKSFLLMPKVRSLQMQIDQQFYGKTNYNLPVCVSAMTNINTAYFVRKTR